MATAEQEISIRRHEQFSDLREWLVVIFFSNNAMDWLNFDYANSLVSLVGRRRQRPPLSALKKTCRVELISLIEQMWSHQPLQRPSMSKVLDELRDLLP